MTEKQFWQFLEKSWEEMGKLLLDKKVHLRTKEAIMIILAHISSRVALSILEQYNVRPDRRLNIFARIALDECQNGQSDNQHVWQTYSHLGH